MGGRVHQPSSPGDEQWSYDGQGIVDVAVRAGMLNIFQYDLWHMVLPVQGPTRK